MPIGFDRARKHKNNLKYINHNKKDGGKLYFSGCILSSKCHDRSKSNKIRQTNLDRSKSRDSKSRESNIIMK